MGQFGEASCSPTFKMVSTLILLPLLAGCASAQLGQGFVPGALASIGDLAAQQAYLQDLLNIINGQQQYSALQVQAQHAARTKRSPQLVPGALPALGSLEQQQAYLLELQNYINFQQQFTQVQLQSLHAARTRRSVPIPGSPEVAALTANPVAAAYWYGIQLQELQNQLNAQAAALGAAS